LIELKIGDAAPPDAFSNWVSIVEHISALLAALAWPVALIGLALIFKKEIIGLLGRLQSADVAGAKMEFGEKVSNVQRQMPDIAENVLNRVEAPNTSENTNNYLYAEEGGDFNVDIQEKYERISKAIELFKQVENVSEQPYDISGSVFESPNEKIHNSWSKLERSIDELFMQKIPENLTTGTLNRIWKLADKGYVPIQLANTIQELQSIRSQIHAQPGIVVGPAEAAEFARTATQMRQMVELLAAPETRLKDRK
jgi:hypothetical protein